MDEKKKGVKESLEKMREMAKQGYDPRQIGLSLIKPQMGRKVFAKQMKLSAVLKPATVEECLPEEERSSQS